MTIRTDLAAKATSFICNGEDIREQMCSNMHGSGITELSTSKFWISVGRTILYICIFHTLTGYQS